MLDDNRDFNRDLDRRDPLLNNPTLSEGSGYAPLVALAAIALIVGGLFVFSPSSDQTKVATNNAPNAPITRTTPAPVTPAPPAVTPAPPAATPAPATPQ
jgi:hypothetical protein